MKKQIFTIILLLMGGVSTFGQFKFDSGTNSLRLQTNGVDRMYIAPVGVTVSAGNVGIGTNTPTTKLHIMNGSAGAVTAFPTTVATLESNTSGYLSILTPATLQGGVIFGSPVNNNNGYVTYWHPLNSMYLGTNSTTRMTIDGVGNVGIGTITPQAKLDVNGDFALSGITTSNVNGGITALNRGGNSVINFTGAGFTQTVRGIAGGSQGMILYLLKEDLVTLTLVNDDLTAPLGNRIYTHTATDFTSAGGNSAINRLGGITLIYIGDHWRVASIAE